MNLIQGDPETPLTKDQLNKIYFNSGSKDSPEARQGSHHAKGDHINVVDLEQRNNRNRTKPRGLKNRLAHKQNNRNRVQQRTPAFNEQGVKQFFFSHPSRKLPKKIQFHAKNPKI